MIWTDEMPLRGHTRTRRVFAWWPTRMSDGTTVVWLKRYVQVEAYSRQSDNWQLLSTIDWRVIERRPE